MVSEEQQELPLLPSTYLVRFHRKDLSSPDGVVGTLQRLHGGSAPTLFRSKQELLERLELERATGPRGNETTLAAFVNGKARSTGLE